MAIKTTLKSIEASIIIVNYNGKALIGACIESIEAQTTDVSFEIIVVDNGSTDGSVEYVRTSYPNVKILEQSLNLGFGKANNLGAKVAQGEYLIFLNSDTTVDENWLVELLRAIRNDSRVGAVSPRVYVYSATTKTRKVQNAGNLIFKQGYAMDRGAIISNGVSEFESDSSFYDQPNSIPACCGVSMLVRKDVFQKVGGFDPDFFMYYEDIDLSLRLREKGYQCVYAPSAKLLHHHGATSKIASPFFIFHTERSRMLFVAKHYPLKTLLLTLFSYLGFVTVALMRGLSMVLASDNLQMNRWFEITRLRCSVLLQVLGLLPSILLRTRTNPFWRIRMNLYETFL